MSTAGSDLDKAAELVGTVKQFLKVIEGRTAACGSTQGGQFIKISDAHALDECRIGHSTSGGSRSPSICRGDQSIVTISHASSSSSAGSTIWSG